MNCQEITECFNNSYQAVIFLLIAVVCLGIWLASHWFTVPYTNYAVSTLLAIAAGVTEKYGAKKDE